MLVDRPLVVHHVRRGRADTGLVVAFAGVEGAPLGAAVDFVFLDDEAAVLTHGLAVFGVVCSLLTACSSTCSPALVRGLGIHP